MSLRNGMRMLQRSFLLTCLLAVATLCWSQVDRGTVTGTVTESSGAVVPGTSVTARNTATGVQNATVTDSAGVYTVPNLPIGRYNVQISKQGFKTEHRTDLDIETGNVVRIDVALQVGSTSESVTVSDKNTVLLDTDNGTQGANIEVKAVRDLPLTFYGGRDAEQFAFNTAAGAEGNNYISH